MPFVKLSEIKFNDAERIRQDLQPDGIKELAESISNVGLINPIVIDQSMRLLTGRRRLEAHKLLKRDEIEVRYYEDLDPIQRRIVEYDENAKRGQLTWQEGARAIQEIHLLLSAANREHTMGETAQALGVSIAKVSEDLMLANGLGNERVDNRPSRKGALQTFKREREMALVRELASRRVDHVGEAIGREFIHRFSSLGSIYCATCIDVLRQLPDESIDLVVTDPPWGINLATASQWTKKWVPTYDDSPDAIQKILPEVFRECARVLKPGSHIYVFYPIQETGWWVDTLGSAGFVLRNRPLIWHKASQPSISDIYTSFLPSYESILWGWKPGEGDYRRFFSRPIPESLAVPRSDLRWHENEKPTQLLDVYIEASSEPNEVVLDPFAGGGSTLASAFALGRSYVGIEVDEVNYGKAVERLRELEAGGGSS